MGNPSWMKLGALYKKLGALASAKLFEVVSGKTEQWTGCKESVLNGYD